MNSSSVPTNAVQPYSPRRSTCRLSTCRGDGEQVVASLGAVCQYVVDEVLSGEPLALQPSLHVCYGEDDGVDRAGRDAGPELVDAQCRFRHASSPLVGRSADRTFSEEPSGRRPATQLRKPRSRAAVPSTCSSISTRARST